MKSIVKSLISRTKVHSFVDACEYEILERPHYAYCVIKAAELAKKLGLDCISVIEFGVAGGNGLLLLQDYAKRASRELNIRIKVIGFDTGKGMPAATDPRDLPYLWFENDFKMDEVALRSKLDKETELVIGEIKETLGSMEDVFKEYPVGAVIFDVDYYSSTMQALKIFGLPNYSYLPRVLCFFDNIIGRAEFPINEHVAELAAINDFNAMHHTKKIGKINHLSYKRKTPSKWNEQVFIFQDFDHALYNVPVRETRNEKTRLKA